MVYVITTMYFLFCYKRINRLDRKDRLAVYANSITTVYDPHTNYFPPLQKEDFDIQMSGRLEGIGAQLQEKDGYIKIADFGLSKENVTANEAKSICGTAEYLAPEIL